jgi:hypothetical protein
MEFLSQDGISLLRGSQPTGRQGRLYIEEITAGSNSGGSMAEGVSVQICGEK